MEIKFSADILASDSESRILGGQIVPFNKVGHTSAGKVMFAEGSFVELDPSKIKLLFEHQNQKPIGKAVSFEVTPDGINAQFKVSKTTRGNDVLVEASDGLRTGFSIGAQILDYTINKNTGVMEVLASELLEVSVVANPAFREDSQITEIAASENAAEPNNENEDIVEENTAVEVEVEASAAEVTVTATQPIYTKPRVKPLSDGEILAHTLQAAAGNSDARRILVEAADDTANNAGFVLEKGLPTFLSNTFEGRPAVDAIGVQALPATGMSFSIPNLTQAPAAAVEGELDDVVTTDLESDTVQLAVEKIAGRQVVSFELLERSEPSFGDIMIRELRRAYAKTSDEYVLAELLNGTAATVQAADWTGLQAFVAKEVPVAYKNTGGLIANELIASADWWAELIGAVDGSDRPVFNAVSPSNASGNVGISAPRGNVFGANLYVDHNISTAGLIDNSAFLVARDAVGVWESPQVSLRTNILSNGSVEILLYGFMSAKVLKSAGVRKYNIA